MEQRVLMCKVCDGFKCPEKQSTCYDGDKIAAFCVRKKEANRDYCDKRPLSQIYEYIGNCLPGYCRTKIKNYCSPDPCKNGGKCKSFPGSFSCYCEPGYHGRDCSLQGGNFRSNVYFIYDPVVGWKSNRAGIQRQVVRSKAMIFLSNIGDSTTVTLTSSCSLERKLVFKKKKTDKLAREKCEAEFIDNETVKKYFCKYLPLERMIYATVYYDIPFDNTNDPPGSIITSYNQDVQTNLAGFKITQLTLEVFNGNNEEYKESFNLISILEKASASECQTAVILLVSGMKCGKLLKRKRYDKISIKSVFDTKHLVFKTGVVCNYIYPTYMWEIYDYARLISNPQKDKPLVSKNCSQFENSNCHEHLEIKPFGLVLGTFEIKLTVNGLLKKTFGDKSLDAFEFNTFGLYLIEIEKSQLIAVIEGGDSRTVSDYDSHVVINGSRSYDPNYPLDQQDDLRWSWTCVGVTGKCCKHNNGKVCEVVEKLERDKKYEFILTLKSYYGLTAQASQKLTVAMNPQLQLEIRCKKNCGLDGYKTNPKEIVYMEVGVVGKQRDATFMWTYSCLSKTKMESVDNIKQDNVDSHILIIKENKLTPGSECKFTVNVDPSTKGFEGESSITIQVNKPLTMGICGISSDCEPDCFKAKAKFTITCSNFTHNSSESAQLVYSFYQNDGQVSLGTLLGFSMTGQLNEVILTDNSVTVRVSDHFGMFVDYKIKVPVQLKDWNPNNQEIDAMISNLDYSVSSRDSASSAMLAGAIIDVMGNVSNKPDIIEKILHGLSKEFVNDLSDVKLYTSTVRKIVSKGIKEMKTQVKSSAVESLGMLMEQLSYRLLLDVNNNLREFPAISDSEIKNITLTMVESADLIASSKDDKAIDVKFGTLAAFARTNQYKRGTSNMIGGLMFSGLAILGTLLPHQEEVIVKSDNTTMWTKVESSLILANSSGIPKNSTTKIKMSKEFGKKLQRISENVAVQVLTFSKNPYWWDVEDQDVVSEIISVATWQQPESGLRTFYKNLVTDISEELDIYLKLQTTRSETVTGTVTEPIASASPDEKDAAVTVHTLEGPPENSNGKLFVEFENLGNIELRVLLTENIRPDYEMMNDSKIVTAHFPIVSLTYNNISADTLHFIGILPGSLVNPGETVKYRFKMYSVQCKMRQRTVWTSPVCRVGEETTKEVVHCRCSHMSFFGSSVFVAPNTVHPIKDIKLLLTVTVNPLVFTVILIILFLYLFLLIWALRKDKHDKEKRKIIELEDNFPGEKYSYLIVVYTSFNYGSGTDANVGIMLIGTNGSSRRHILRSPKRKVLRRSSDDWFLILSQTSLGKLIGIHLWHDNSGFHPDWFCQKVVVYSIAEGTDYTFIIEQWLSVWPGEYTEAVALPATPQDLYQWKRVIMHNIMYNLREKHMLLSVYMCHPRATVSKSQRLTIAFCMVITNLLCGVMFYGVAKGELQNDEPHYQLKLRVFLIAVESAIISSLAVVPVIICFRRSQIVKYHENKNSSGSTVSDIESISELTKINPRRGVCLKNLMSRMVKGKPLIPVVVGKETAKSLDIRRRWAVCGWTISQAVIWGGGYLIILYGLKLGKVVSELWITSAALSIGSGTFFSSPMKIILISMIISVFGEIYNVTTYEYDPKEALKLDLYGDEKHLKHVMKLRRSNMYKPYQHEIIMEHRKAALIRYQLLDHVEFFASLFLFLILLFVSGNLWYAQSYQVTSHIQNSLSNSHGPLAVPLNSVINVKRLTDYLTSKLLRGLYKGRWYNKRVQLTSAEETLEKMGWFTDTVHRMVGIPRMRQLRIAVANCSWAGLFNNSNVVCGFGLKSSTEDTTNYGLNWGQISGDINKPLLAPWSYQDTLTHGVFVYGESGVPYHSGGYIVDLSDTQDHSNNIVSDLIDLEWWDIKMRGFIIELSLYNPNTDIYSMVSVVIEHLPSGAFTRRVHVTSVHLQPIFLWIMLYLSILIFFNVNLFLSINRQGISSTLSSFWGCYNLVFVGLSDVAIIFYILKIIRASTSVHIFQEAGSSGFFYFSDLVWYQKTTQSIWGLALCLTPIHLLKFKSLISTCHKAYYALFKARKLLLTVTIGIIAYIVVQLYIINFKIFPEHLPFDVDSKFYSLNEKETFINSCNNRQQLTLLLSAIMFGVSNITVRIILINVYKIVTFNCHIV